MAKAILKDAAKTLLRKVAPAWYDVMMTARINRHGQWVMAQHGIPAIAAEIVKKHGSKVLDGPFAGMEYVLESAGSSFLPKLVGSYESELRGVMVEILKSRYDTIIDVGSAEGFYAVGLAMLTPEATRVYAFDIDSGAQKLCRVLALKNRVEEKITVAGFCDTQTLQRTLRGTSLVISDCEGYEIELLQPAAAPALTTADILVELHDCLQPGLTTSITRRFEASHDIALFDSVEKDPSDYPAVSFLPPEQQVVAVSEFRNGPQKWAFMTPKK